MSIRLSEEEAWAVIDGSHTAILTTLRADGSPVALPTWFVTDGRTVCFRTPARTKKVARIARDPRASFLVESGERWAELCAVHLNGTIEPIDDDAEKERIAKALDAKYNAFRTAATAMPDATRAAYTDWKFYRFVPEPRALTWDNSRIALKD